MTYSEEEKYHVGDEFVCRYSTELYTQRDHTQLGPRNNDHEGTSEPIN